MRPIQAKWHRAVRGTVLAQFVGLCITLYVRASPEHTLRAPRIGCGVRTSLHR